jgi:hypothetical protein
MRAAHGALAGLLALVLLGGLPEAHAHHDRTPGLYHEECPLDRLATPGWGLAMLAPAGVRPAEPIAAPAMPSSPGPPARPAGRTFAPRGPPAIR